MKPFAEGDNHWAICFAREWPLAALLALPHIILRLIGRQGFITSYYRVPMTGHQHTLMFSNNPVQVRLINAYYGWQFRLNRSALERRTRTT